jgi:hypothetical protein
MDDHDVSNMFSIQDPQKWLTVILLTHMFLHSRSLVKMNVHQTTSQNSCHYNAIFFSILKQTCF